MTVTAGEELSPYSGNTPSNASAIIEYLIADDNAVLRQIKTLNSLEYPISYKVDLIPSVEKRQ